MLFITLHAPTVKRFNDPSKTWHRLLRALRSQLMQRQRSYTHPSHLRVQECVARLAALMRDTSSTADDIRDAEVTLKAACVEHDRVRTDLQFKRDLVETETSSSFFFWPPSNSFNRNPISTARGPNGVITSVQCGCSTITGHSGVECLTTMDGLPWMSQPTTEM